MLVTPTPIPDVKLIEPRKLTDPRGFFSEVYNARAMADAGIGQVFVQDNHAYSAQAGVVRGLHYQAPPHAQAKLVRVTRGRIVDVAVDLRPTSPTFRRHVMVELSADNWRQLLIPVGFAHGYLTLEPETEVLYKVTDYYSPADDRGVIWNDPDLAIPWPISAASAQLSAKDANLPRLCDLKIDDWKT